MKAYYLLISIFSLLLFSCSKEAPNLSQPITHQHASHHINYPGNWSIIGSENTAEYHSSFFDTTAGGIFILKTYPMANAKPIEDFATSFSECSSQTPAQGKMRSLGFSKRKTGETSSSINETFIMEYLGKEIHFTRLFKTMDLTGDRAYLILQAPTENINLLYPGFEFVYQSLAQ